MRVDALGKVLEIMMPDDGAGMLRDQFRPGHPRVTIRVDEINASPDKHIAQIVATHEARQEQTKANPES